MVTMLSYNMRFILDKSARMLNEFQWFLAVTQVWVWMRLIEQFDNWQYVSEVARPYEKFFQIWKRQARSYDSELDCIVIREAHFFDFEEEPLADGVPWMLKIGTCLMNFVRLAFFFYLCIWVLS